jgi:hypothetical protein
MRRRFLVIFLRLAAIERGIDSDVALICRRIGEGITIKAARLGARIITKKARPEQGSGSHEWMASDKQRRAQHIGIEGQSVSIFRTILFTTTTVAIFSSAARAADLPSTKPAPAPPPILASCASPTDFITTNCPLTWYGITILRQCRHGRRLAEPRNPLQPLDHLGRRRTRL